MAGAMLSFVFDDNIEGKKNAGSDTVELLD